MASTEMPNQSLKDSIESLSRTSVLSLRKTNSFISDCQIQDGVDTELDLNYEDSQYTENPHKQRMEYRRLGEPMVVQDYDEVDKENSSLMANTSKSEIETLRLKNQFLEDLVYQLK